VAGKVKRAAEDMKSRRYRSGATEKIWNLITGNFQEAITEANYRDNYPPAAPPAEIFVSTSGSGPHQSGPDRILMILWRRPSFSGMGGAHDRRYPWPAYVHPAEGVACSGVAGSEAGLASWG